MMFVAVMLFFIVIGLTIVVGRKGEGPADVPVSDTLTAPSRVGWELTLDRLGLWFIAAIALIAIAYGPFLLTYDVRAVSGPFRAF